MEKGQATELRILNVRVPPSLHDELTRLAAERGESVATIVRSALRSTHVKAD